MCEHPADSIQKSPKDLTDNFQLHFRNNLESEDDAIKNQEKLTVPLDPTKIGGPNGDKLWDLGFSHTAPTLNINNQGG